MSTFLTLAAAVWLGSMPSMFMTIESALLHSPTLEQGTHSPEDEVMELSAPPSEDEAQPEAVLADDQVIEPITAEPVVFADLSDDEVFEKAADALEEITSLKARFEQVSPSGTHYLGDLALRRPGQLRFDYDDPSPQLIVATNRLVYVHDSELETTDTYPINETPLKFLLTKRLDREAAELVDVRRGAEKVTLFIAATDDETQGQLALAFSAPEMTLTGWGILEPGGAVTAVELSNVETGMRLSNRLFRAPEAGGAFLRN